MVDTGAAFEERDVPGFRESHAKLEHALIMLNQENFRAWMSLGGPGDPSVAAEHRRKVDEGLYSPHLFVDCHDRAVRLLATFLEKERLHVVFPKQMTSREEQQVKRLNDEFFALYRRLRDEGRRKTPVVEIAAEIPKACAGVQEHGGPAPRCHGRGAGPGWTCPG